MNRHLAIDLILLAFASIVLYSLSFSQVEIFDKSPPNQRDQSFVFPMNFTDLQKPLYSRFIFMILDGVTYDFVDNRVKVIPFSKPECDIHTHQITVFNDLLSENPDSVVFQRLNIEPPPKTEIKIATYLRGTNPFVFSTRIPEQDPYKNPFQDSVLYQLSQSDNLKKNYGYLTYFLYDYIGYHLTQNYFALNPSYGSFQSLKDSNESKFKEYIATIKQKNYDTLFIYEGIFDEVGHSQGIHTEDGLAAQKQVDFTIRSVVENMDDDAVLIITSDHGKSERGAHFDCKDNDTTVCNSVFFAYTKNGFVQNDEFIKQIRRKENDERISNQAGQFKTHESMVASTISNLLNIPIPFINSGRPLFEVYPKSRFTNRMEMLQRVLQDSFATLEQQKQLFHKIQSLTNIYERFEYQSIISQIERIENQLFYELRGDNIYVENKIEAIIKDIINLSDTIQDKIYSTKFYSNGLMIFGMAIGCLVAAIYLLELVVNYLIRTRLIIPFCFIIIATTYSFYVFYLNEVKSFKNYGIITSVALVVVMGITELKKKGRALMSFLFIGLNYLISNSTVKSELDTLAAISEMLIFGLHFQTVTSNKNAPLKNKQVQVYILLTLILSSLNGFFRLNSMDTFCLATSIAFFLYSLYIEDHLNLNYFSQGKFQVNLMMITILWNFLAFTLNNSSQQECNKYYSIVIVNAYLISYIASIKESIYNSFYTQIQILVSSAIMYEILGLPLKYNNRDFNIILIILYYLPLPFISCLCQVKKQSSPQKQDLKYIPQKDEENAGFNNNSNSTDNSNNMQTESAKEQKIISTMITSTDNEESSSLVKQRKKGIILYCFVAILCSCLGQLLIIKDHKIFDYFRTDRFIYNHEYIMTSVVTILVSNLFIR